MGLRDLRRGRGERRGADPTSENIDLLDDGGNIFAESVDAGHGMDPRMRKVFLACVVLVAVYAVGLVIPKDLLNFALHQASDTAVSGADYTLSQFAIDLQANVAGLFAVAADPESSEAASTVSRIVRYLVVALAGAGLALSGAVYQGAFRNALVSPSTLGVMTGGQLGRTVWVVLSGTIGGGVYLGVAMPGADGSIGPLEYLTSSFGLALCSFAGCFLVVGLVLLVMRFAGAQRLSGVMMIITGQVVGALMGVVTTLASYYFTTVDPYGDIAQLLQELQVASFYRAFTWIDVVALGVPLGITLYVVMRLRQKMMMLAFDKTEQRTMGIDTGRMQFAVVSLCTLLTAIIISFCGTIGFVGFLVPHLARRLVGPNFKYLLPAATVIGAIFVLGAYLLIEVISSSYTEMAGMFISIGGAAVFLVTALRGKGAAYGTFR